MLRCGLLGRKLSHSWSPPIHALLGSYEYLLFEKEEDEVESFILSGAWDCLNVTIPYKKTVLAWVDDMTETARRVGSVNTLIRRKDGTIFGDNTDVFGFTAMVRSAGFDLRGEKALVLGSGGASVAVLDALRTLQAHPVIISRSGADNYENLERHADASFVVNTTPVGMYPATDASPLDLRRIPGCRGVLDLIYNPTETKLMRQAESLGIPSVNGLYMLVAQALRSAEQFLGKEIPETRIGEIFQIMAKNHP